MKTREVRSLPSGGEVCICTQKQLPNGEWLHVSARWTPIMTEIDHSQRGHARLAPSNSKCWTTCTASVAFIAENAHRVKEGDTRYADEGTQAHEYCEAVLRGTITLAEVPNGKDVDFPEGHAYRGKDFRTHVTTYVEHCLELAGDDLMDIELQVPLFYAPEDTGTMDFACVKSEDLLYIRDLKYGAGVFVDAVDNPQLAIYALSTVRMLQDEGLYAFHPGTVINIGVVQPRYRGDEPIRIWEITLNDLETFCRDIEYAAIQIREGRGLKFAPSEDGCRWCKAKGFCSARAEWAASALEYDGGSGVDVLLELPDLTKEDSKLPVEERLAACTGESLSDETLVALFERSKAITSFLSDVAEYLNERVQGGERIEGVKLVMGREGNREFIDEEAADKLVSPKLKAEDRYKPKQLLSPTQLEAKLKEALTSTRFKNCWDKLVSRSPAKTVLALASDQRNAVTPTVDSLPNLEDEEGL